MRITCHRLIAATLVLVAMFAGSAVRAAEPDQGLSALLSQFGGFHLPGMYERNHARVKSAFRDVVDLPSKSTVRILCGGKSVALGTVVDAEGYILTKASELSHNVECQLSSGRRLPATVVGVLREHDLAMLKVDAQPLPAVEWNVQGLRVGSLLATPGLGAVPASIGVVSARTRPVAALRAVLGVKLSQANRGARIDQVFDGSGAAQAGLLVADIVTHLNGKRIAHYQQLMDALAEFQPGDRLQLAVAREGKSLQISAVLGSLDELVHEDLAFQETLGGDISVRRAGFPNVLQHDTVLKPADCGGPVVDLDGKVVGINIARAGRVASYAIPSSVVVPLLADLKSGRLAPITLPDSADEHVVARPVLPNEVHTSNGDAP